MDPNIKAYVAIRQIDLEDCFFTVDDNSNSTITTLIEQAEEILAACCPGGDEPCELSKDKLTELIDIFDDINNNRGLSAAP